MRDVVVWLMSCLVFFFFFFCTGEHLSVLLEGQESLFELVLGCSGASTWVFLRTLCAGPASLRVPCLPSVLGLRAIWGWGMGGGGLLLSPGVQRADGWVLLALRSLWK